MHHRAFFSAVVLVSALGFSACEDTTGAHDERQLTLAFSMASPTTSAQLSGGSTANLREDVVVTGSNGTLVISDVAFIVDEFKLERSDDACEGVDGEDDLDDDCENFETGVEFVRLPLTGATAAVVTRSVPVGTYTEIKFEVADADLDEAADDDDAEEIIALIEQIEAAGFTDWPADASLVIVGTFTPTGGEPRPFTAYFEAEVKVEMAFDPALVIDGENGTVDVEIDPAAWFGNPDGTVIDLSMFDFVSTGQVVEFEAKMEHGFRKIELEGFDD
ncbi:MAG: hypothetical protein ACRELT_13940 [Longimicrobiales bacterium]